MPNLPPFIAPERFTDAASALAQVMRIYDGSITHLRLAMQRFVAGEDGMAHVRACYPLVRIHTDTVSRSITPESARLSYGFVAGPGRFETTLTRPDLYYDYYLEQFSLLLQNHEVELEVGTSSQPIPVHFSFAENDHVEGNMPAQRRTLMRDVFDLPDLAAMDDGIANGTHQPRPGESQPLALFTAPRVDYSLHRLRHYTGTRPEHFQNFVLFTNYQFYIDEFITLGHAAMQDPNSEYIAFIEPGNVITRRLGLNPEIIDSLGKEPARLPQMPGYHLVRNDRAGRDPGGTGVGRVRGHPAQRPGVEKHHAHRHGGQYRQPQLGTAARQPAPAPLQSEPCRGTGHGERHHCRQRIPIPRALRHPAVRE